MIELKLSWISFLALDIQIIRTDILFHRTLLFYIIQITICKLYLKSFTAFFFIFLVLFRLILSLRRQLYVLSWEFWFFAWTLGFLLR